MELALDEGGNAVALAVAQSESCSRRAARSENERIAGGGEPARGGRAVDAVEGSDAIDAQTLAEMKAQDGSLPGAEVDERSHDRGLELRLVALLHVRKIGPHVDEPHHLRVFVGGLLAPPPRRAPHHRDRGRRGRRHPAAEGTGAAVVGEFRELAGQGGEQTLVNDLGGVIGQIGRRAPSRKDARDDAAEGLMKRVDRPRRATDTRAGEVKIARIRHGRNLPVRCALPDVTEEYRFVDDDRGPCRTRRCPIDAQRVLAILSHPSILPRLFRSGKRAGAKGAFPGRLVRCVMDPTLSGQPKAMCLGEDTIARFVGGVLEKGDLARAESHLAGCASCRSVLADAAYGAAPSIAADGADTDVDGGEALGSLLVPVKLPERGDVLAGKYRIEEPLGRGGMGAVFAARHLELGNRVAIKVLFRGEGEATARFLREARTCARLTSENVVRVFDVGRLEGGTPYLVMEYLTGSDLGHVIKAGSVTIADAVTYVLHACAGLAEAHAVGVVHRDLKPANLFLTARGDGSILVKVLDFGISKLLHDDAGDLSLTKTQSFMGSPIYMSPEQLQDSKDVDKRTDIWSLGVILYVLLTGKPPFAARALSALSVQIATAIPASPSSLRTEVPAALEVAILHCLEKDRSKRYGHLAELALALAPFAPLEGGALAERVVRIGGGSHVVTPANDQRAGVVALIGGVLIAGAVGVAAMMSRGDGSTVSPPPPVSSATSSSAASGVTIATASAPSTRPNERDAGPPKARRNLPAAGRPGGSPRSFGPTDTPD